MSQDNRFLTLNRFFNPNAPFGLGGATVFVDAKATSPASGAGTTTATVALARTESSPLDGIASYLYTGATNAQGQGWRFDVPIQPSDWTKPFTLKFDYQITSGTYYPAQFPVSGSTFSDFTMWCYSAGSATFIDQFSNWQVDGAVNSNNQYSYQGSWQCPSGATFARVIFYQGNAVSVPFTARFNNISFGREPRVQGNVYTNPVTFGATSSWGSTNTTYTGSWYRDGGFGNYKVNIALAGAPIGSSLVIQLPPGHVIDTSSPAFPTTPVAGMLPVGRVEITDVSDTPDTPYQGVVSYNTTTSVACRAFRTINGNLYVSAQTDMSATDPITFANGDYVYAEWRVPILGWGANGTLGQDADTRVIASRCQLGGATLIVTPQGLINFSTVNFDTAGAVTTGASWKFTAPVAGVYNFNACITTGMTAELWDIYKNGAFYNRVGSISAFAGTNTPGQDSVYLNAGDYVSLYSGVGITLVFGTTYGNYVNIQRVSGPAQVQAPEVITARYSTNAGATINNNSATVMDYEDKTYDDHGIVTTGATWKATAPRAGKVRVNAKATLVSNAGWGVGETAYLAVFKNGAEYGRGPFDSPVTATIVVNLSVEDEVDVVAGDYIDIRIFQNSGGNIALDTTSAKNYVSINFVGGITQ